jgi:hypothetical protein
VFGEWVPGEVAAEPLYDAEGTRVRASTPRPVDTPPGVRR